MKTKMAVVGWGVWAVMCCGACTTEIPKSVRGESCDSRADCAGGLRCISNVCVIDEVPIAVNARECVVTECAGVDQCTGDMDGRACRSGTCGCNSDADCNNGMGTGGRFCFGNKCSRCQADTDCGTGMYCTFGQCRTMCRTTSDCSDFYTCQSGRCEYTGCSSDRECISVNRDWRSRCVPPPSTSTTGRPICVVACATDLDCGVNASSGSYHFQRCVGGLCTRVGCESDVECRAQTNTRTLMPPAVTPTVTCQ